MNRPIAPALLALVLLASMVDAASVVSFDASANPDTIPLGGAFTAEVTLDIEESWHIYGMNTPEGPVATSLTLTGPEGFAPLGSAVEPEPAIYFDQGFQIDLPKHEGQVTFSLPIQASEDLEPGEYTLTLQVRYQPCTDTACLRPSRENLEVQVTIDPTAERLDPSRFSSLPPSVSEGSSAGAASLPAVITAEDPSLQTQLFDYRAAGLLRFLMLAAISGFAALLTPCVFPMIPITVSLFTKRGERGEGSAVGAALVYALTIIGTFTLLGMILAASWGASGARNLAANPWLNLAIGGLFIALALSLFGMFELRAPGWLLNLAGRGQQRGGAAGIVFMGIAFTLTSFTCTVAFVGFLLAQAAQGDWLWPGLGMLVFSSCFALPFFLLALFPQWISRMPQAGGWMNITKVLMGFLELAAAMKFLSNADLVWGWGILRNDAVLVTWSAIGLFMTLHLVGAFRLTHDSPTQSLSVGRMLLGMGSAMLTLTLMVGLFGGPLPVLIATYLPEVGDEELEWVTDLDVGLASAQATGRPIFIDFTGYTCTNCRQMEIQIFPDPEVRALLEQFVRVKLYTDDLETGDRWAALQDERFGNSALPFYAILTPDNRIVDTHAGMMRPAAAFADFLRSALDRGA